VEGGYKAYQRRAGERQLPALQAARCQYRVVCGHHGFRARPGLLHALAAEGAQVLDFEGPGPPPQLGAGAGAGPDPTQPERAFDNRVWEALRGFDPARPVFYIESESKKVGNVAVPESADVWPCGPAPACGWNCLLKNA
jgi:tRNA 2-selenouridine synthase